MPLAYAISLATAGLLVSAIGAFFSVTGLAALFSGAFFAVAFMAGSLEFAKLVIAAYLHRAWHGINPFMKMYMCLAVFVLSVITSLGIFGFLTNAYQQSSLDLNQQILKIDAIKEEDTRAGEEIKRVQALIDSIPPNRITKRIATQKEYDPVLLELKKKRDKIAADLRELQLTQLTTNTKVGPLIFVSKAFNIPIDDVVKWLILIFVSVFDPLAICLVIATSNAYAWREWEKNDPEGLRTEEEGEEPTNELEATMSFEGEGNEKPVASKTS